MRTTSEKVYAHEERDDLVSARPCSEKGAEKQTQIEGNGKRHPQASTTEHVDFSKGALKETEQHQRPF